MKTAAGTHQRRSSRARRFRARVRQAALTHAAMWLTRNGRPRRQRAARLRTVELDLHLPSLPADFDGLRITHLSDLHIGPMLGAADLPAIVQAANHLRGDLIAVTGDFVDLSLDVLDDVIAALKQLEAPLGVWLVPGNHDYLEDGPQLLRRCRAAGLRFLVNQAVTLPFRGKTLLVAGIDFAHRRRDLSRLVRQTLLGSPDHMGVGLRLLLSHHPDAFDWAVKHNVDLTLAGHTHGGQLVLARTRGKRRSIGPGAMAFRYPHGLYQHGPHYLYVTTGVGSWFPLRIQCPAEIACLSLRCGNGGRARPAPAAASARGRQ